MCWVPEKADGACQHRSLRNKSKRPGHLAEVASRTLVSSHSQTPAPQTSLSHGCGQKVDAITILSQQLCLLPTSTALLFFLPRMLCRPTSLVIEHVNQFWWSKHEMLLQHRNLSSSVLPVQWDWHTRILHVFLLQPRAESPSHHRMAFSPRRYWACCKFLRASSDKKSFLCAKCSLHFPPKKISSLFKFRLCYRRGVKYNKQMKEAKPM